MPTLTPCLWFDGQAEQAAALYVDVFPRSEVVGTARYPAEVPGEEGRVLTVDVRLDGQPFTLLDGGPQFPQSEAVSFQVDCTDQAEVDHYWDRLTADGGQESQCGWLKDRFGVSWQVVPRELPAMISDPDRGRAERATAAMMEMRKIDIAAVRAAADAVPVG